MNDKPTIFDPSKPWEDQLVCISLERCLEDRKTWIEIHRKQIAEGRDKQFDLEDELEIFNALTFVLYYYRGR
jgi:hypothetical protein